MSQDVEASYKSYEIQSNENQALISTANDSVRGVFSYWPGFKDVFNSIKTGLGIGVTAGTTAAATVAATAAATSPLGTAVHETISGFWQYWRSDNVMNTFLGLGDVGPTVGRNIGEISEHIRDVSQGMSYVVNNATALQSRFLLSLNNSISTDGLTPSTIVKCALVLFAAYYGRAIIRQLAQDTCNIMRGINRKILEVIEGPNRGQTNTLSVQNRTLYIEPKTNKARKSHRGTVISNYRPPKRILDRTNQRNIKNEKKIINAMAMYLTGWLDTELNKEPRTALVEILRQIPDQLVKWLAGRGVDEDQQEDLRQYMLERTPCDVIEWFYYTLSRPNIHAKERVKNWINQLPICKFIDQPPLWMNQQTLETLLELPVSEKYQVPENNISLDTLQAYLNQHSPFEQSKSKFYSNRRRSGHHGQNIIK